MFKQFLSELRHRRVLQTAVAYALIAAAVVEFTDIVTPALGIPVGVLRGVIIIALVGFPVVIVLAWFFDLTSGGFVRGTASPQPSSTRGTQKISILLIALLGIAVVYLSYRLYWENQDQAGFTRGMSIAVLPFASISADAEPETDYFGDGVAEEILNALSGIDGLRVAARTSSFSFREDDVRDVGEALNVSVVLQGSVRRAGDQLRITAQLIDTDNGFQLWSEVYKHKLEDIFLIQEEIALAIVKALRLELFNESSTRLVSPGTDSSQAYDKYLEGRKVLQARTPAAAQQAISIFGEALAFDPDYAQAYAGLADSWIVLREVGNLSLLEATQQSHTAISKALQLNVALAEAQASLGLCILGGGDKSVAGRQFQKAIDLDPEYSDGYLLRANLLRDQGYLAEATRVYSQALALDPFNPAILENQALLFALQGRFDLATEQLSALQQSVPGRLTGSLTASRVAALAGDNQNALEYAQHAVDIAPESPVALAALLDSRMRLGELEQAQVVLDRMQETAPKNETAIKATMRFYLMTGEFEAFDSIAASRVAPYIDNPGWAETDLLFERVAWAAVARMVLGDTRGARELFEKGFKDPARLDPQPAVVQTLALMAQARRLDGDPEGAAEMATYASQLIERARAQGWDDFVLANYDPVMKEIFQLPAFQALSK